jgi:hypothetical protein
MRRMLLAGCGATAVALVVLAAGCTKPPTPVDVDGKVVFEVPRPKAPMLVRLHPRDDANKSSTPTSPQPIGEDGSFHLPKCLPGRYKATLVLVPNQVGGNPTAASPGDMGAPGGPAASGLPKAYQDEQASPWEVTVTDGKQPLVLTVSQR